MLYSPLSFKNAMPDTESNPELLRSLGRLARGLSALFWGLPTALIVCVSTAKTDYLRPSGVIPAIAAMGLLYFGLWQIGKFQPQERPWRSALDRARFAGLANIGLCPFLFWWNRFPNVEFFVYGVAVLALSGLIFLFNLNLVLERLGAMLPDETLRQETRQFTALNRGLLIALVLLTGVYLFLLRMPEIPTHLGVVAEVLARSSFWVVVFLLLLPLAMTMALIWKAKEVILESVFGAK
jgi:hypothetical protein